jgi:DNA-binding NarL/FixJ family response regulator
MRLYDPAVKKATGKRYNFWRQTLQNLNICLTRRQLDVIEAIEAGCHHHKEIARHLKIDPLTAQHHVGEITKRLGLKNKIQLVVWVATHGAQAPGDDGE